MKDRSRKEQKRRRESKKEVAIEKSYIDSNEREVEINRQLDVMGNLFEGIAALLARLTNEDEAADVVRQLRKHASMRRAQQSHGAENEMPKAGELLMTTFEPSHVINKAKRAESGSTRPKRSVDANYASTSEKLISSRYTRIKC